MPSVLLAGFITAVFLCPCYSEFTSQESSANIKKSVGQPLSYPCTLWHEGQQFKARCGKRGLREVPSYLPPDITVLDLSMNKFEILSNETFANVPAVAILNLFKNQIWHIEKEAFYPLLRLEELTLGYNHLSNLHADTFSMNQNIRFLDFSRNAFTSIPLTALNQLPFSSTVNFDANVGNQFRFTGHLLTRINIFYLSKNNITRMSVNDFTPLSMAAIFRLKLCKNNITYIPYGAFRQLKHVKGLDLQKNALKNVSFDSFIGMDSLEYLNLFDSAIHRIRGFRFNTTLRIPPLVNLSLSGNRVLSLSDGVFHGLNVLLSLSITSCRMKSLQNRTFEGLTSLQTLDLSHNFLTTIAEPVLQYVPNLQTLILFQNKLFRMNFQLSGELQHLNFLDLSANEIREIPNDFFRIESLVTLDMSKNLILSLTSHPFSFLSNLTCLILKSNPIRIMTEGGFTGLGNLEILDLRNLGFLDLRVPFKYLQRLSFLDLSYNNGVLGGSSFDGLISLRRLDLSSAAITREELVRNTGPVLSGLSSLEVLLLKRNPLRDLYPNTFNGLLHLRELFLSKCGIKSLPNKLFANLSSLERLYLDGNHIFSVSFDHFRHLTSLRYLRLSTNSLSGNLPKDIFRQNRQLFVVSLCQNSLTGIEEDTFLPMKYLDISKNHLACTCNLSWFRSFLSQGNVTLSNPETTVCSPQSILQFVGKSILEFEPDIVCGPNLTVYISASALIITCIVGSLLVWRNRWWLNYKCFHLRLLIIGYYELEDARDHEDYRYDLNIIFPDEDEGWVLGEFLGSVQEHLPDFQRNRIVCGDDDLPLGSTRLDAIDRVIENCFKNLVVVSNASVNDAYYLMTLQMAVAHMNDVQLENVVMVFREDIADNQLPYLVRLFLSKNKPYFQWSEERYQQMLFWEGLAKTLARNKKMNGLLPL